jgi:predicted DNA-binding transcriptional regulator YafY
MLDGRRHFQSELAEEFECSPQSIIRMVGDIEMVVGVALESGFESRRRWYQIKTISRSRLGLDYEELRYLSVCRDLAGPVLPDQVLRRVDDTIFNLSVLMADQGFADREKVQRNQLAFFSKGKIDYSQHFERLEKLLRAGESKRVCLIKYKTPGAKEEKEHRFAPGRIISMGSALYITGASLGDSYNKIKYYTNLAIHRVTDVIVTDRRFKFDLPDLEPNSFGLPWHEPKTFRIHFTAGKAAEYVRERIWAENQKFEDTTEGDLILELTTRSEPELMAWIRSFGEEAWLEPPKT